MTAPIGVGLMPEASPSGIFHGAHTAMTLDKPSKSYLDQLTILLVMAV